MAIYRWQRWFLHEDPHHNRRQIHLTRHFSHAVCTLNCMHITLHGSRRATQRVCVCASFHLHVIHDVCLSVHCLSLRVRPSPSSLHHSTCTLPGTSSPMSITPREITAAPSHNEKYCSMAIYHPPTGYEPNVLDDFHNLEILP